MPKTWISGLVTWISGLVIGLLLLIGAPYLISSGTADSVPAKAETTAALQTHSTPLP